MADDVFAVPLGANPWSDSIWNPVIKMISKWLDNWKGAFFSLGGRVTLIQSCLSGVLLYYLYLFKILVEAADKIERLMWDFFYAVVQMVAKGITYVASL